MKEFRSNLDLGLYLVIDLPTLGARSFESVLKAAILGGVSIVQLRHKHATNSELKDLGREMLRILQPYEVPLIINDRVDVAIEIGAAGVHLGSSDMPWAEARQRLGADAIIGLSVESMEEAGQAEQADIDYFGVSTIFSTPTKQDTKYMWGLSGLAALRRLSTKKLVAIGGIDVRNAAEVIRAGADGLAVVSAICAASDPENTARRLRLIVERTQR